MKWIKASQIIPRDGDNHWIRIDGESKRLGIFFQDEDKSIYCRVLTNGAAPEWDIPYSKFNGIEWLYEEAPTTVDEKEELEGRFAEWATGNDWKFYLGDKVWRREWQLQRTTPELIKEWKKSLQK